MAIPKQKEILKPLVDFLSDGELHSLKEAYNYIEVAYSVSPEERDSLYEVSGKNIFETTVRFSRNKLKDLGLLDNSNRGSWRLTDLGLEFSKKTKEEFYNDIIKINVNKSEKREVKVIEDEKVQNDDFFEDPLKLIEDGYFSIKKALQKEILDRVCKVDPYFFEKIIVELIVKLGYGGSVKDAGEAIGRSGDGGIDGVIKQDILGLEKIYIQAKRWDNIVGRPEIQKFAGALQGRNAIKGIFVTTSGYTNNAIEYVKNLQINIILIDGDMLSKLMFDHNLGVFSETEYKIKKIDLDYFEEE